MNEASDRIFCILYDDVNAYWILFLISLTTFMYDNNIVTVKYGVVIRIMK